MNNIKTWQERVRDSYSEVLDGPALSSFNAVLAELAEWRSIATVQLQSNRYDRLTAALSIIKQDYSPECLAMASTAEYVEDAVGQLIDAGYVPVAAHQQQEKASAPVSVPEGWKLTRCEDGAIIVQKDGLGGYAAWKDDSNIASSILYHFAEEVLATVPAAPIQQEGDRG